MCPTCFAGRWQGALVAIKVVEHNMIDRDECPASVALRIERETKFSTSLAHPNVVSTYKITTVCKSVAEPPAARPASDSVSSISSRKDAEDPGEDKYVPPYARRSNSGRLAGPRWTPFGSCQAVQARWGGPDLGWDDWSYGEDLGGVNCNASWALRA